MTIIKKLHFLMIRISILSSSYTVDPWVNINNNNNKPIQNTVHSIVPTKHYSFYNTIIRIQFSSRPLGFKRNLSPWKFFIKRPLYSSEDKAKNRSS